MNKIGVYIVLVIFVLIGTTAAYAIFVTGKNTDATKTAVVESQNGNNETDKIDSTDESAQNVTINNYKYSSETLTIKSGTTVTWTNQDSVKHDITPDKEGAFTGSQLLSKGQSYSYTFDKPGTYEYHCSPHPYMTAKIVVQ